MRSFAARGARVECFAGRSAGGSQRPRRGVSAVEMALVAPLLVSIFFAIIEFGSIMYTQHVLVEAARAGARQLAIQGTTDDQAVQVTENYLAGANINGATVTVQNAYAGAGDDAAAREIWVNIELPIGSASLLGDVLNVFAPDATLAARSTMRKEGELISPPSS